MVVERIKGAISDSVNWLRFSGIMDMQSPEAGGVFAWYDPTTRTYPFYYSEVTGYMISALVYIEEEIAADSRNLEMAGQAFRWLKDKMWDASDNSFRCRISANSTSAALSHRLCTFDNGIILNGFCHFYRKTKSEEVATMIASLRENLKKRMDFASGFAKHRMLLPDYVFEPEAPGWSKQEGTFLIKALAEVADRSQLDAIVKAQLPTGQIMTDRYDQSTYLHPFCYTLEGMLLMWSAFPEERYRDTVVKGMNWLLSIQDEKTGGFPHLVVKGEIHPGESADINAQVLRIWSVLVRNGWIDFDKKRFGALVERLLSFQDQNKADTRTFGGFRYGYTKSEGEKNHLNSWASIFSMQALHYALKCYEGNSPIRAGGII